MRDRRAAERRLHRPVARRRARPAARPRPAASASTASSRSRPFCQVSRLTTPNSGASGSAARPRRACRAALLAARAGQVLGGEPRRGISLSVAGSQTVIVDAVEDAAQPIRRAAAAARPGPCRLPACGFRRVGRRDRGDPVGEAQPGLQVADVAVIFDAVDAERPRRQAERGQQRRPGTGPGRRGCARSSPCRAARPAVVVQIGRRQPGLPVMRVHDRRGCHAGSRPRRDAGADPRQRGEAQRVVGPVAAVRADIGVARRARTDAARRAPAGRARAAVPRSSRAGPPNRSVERRATAPRAAQRLRSQRDSRAPGCVTSTSSRRQRRGRAPTTSAKAAGLHQRKDFGGDRQDIDRGHQCPARSIIGWVIRQIPARCGGTARRRPPGPRRPPGRPGSRTPRSTITLRSRAPRPISASGRITACSTCA